MSISSLQTCHQSKNKETFFHSFFHSFQRENMIINNDAHVFIVMALHILFIVQTHLNNTYKKSWKVSLFLFFSSKKSANISSKSNKTIAILRFTNLTLSFSHHLTEKIFGFHRFRFNLYIQSEFFFIFIFSCRTKSAAALVTAFGRNHHHHLPRDVSKLLSFK